MTGLRHLTLNLHTFNIRLTDLHVFISLTDSFFFK